METVSQEAPKSKRVLSIDALRGFDMFFISGGAAFLHYIHGKTGMRWVDVIAEQMEHAQWHGFTFYDFIFPLFLFVSGISLAYSMSKHLSLGTPKNGLYKKAFKRMAVLIILGIIYKNSPIPFFEPSQIRLSSVLGRIGVATFITTLLYLNYGSKPRLYWAAGILLGYYLALLLIPVPGYGAYDLSFEGNLPGWIDRHIMPGRLIDGTFDQLAVSTMLPALCLTIFGAWAGDILRDKSTTDNKKFIRLTLTGTALVILGLLWSLHFPINKHLWTSSFILLTGGMGFLAIAIFYGLIDLLHFRKWAFFFKVIGMNSLTIYYAYRFIDFRHTSSKLFDGIFVIFGEQWHDALVAVGALALVWSFLYFLYRKKIFIKV